MKVFRLRYLLAVYLTTFLVSCAQVSDSSNITVADLKNAMQNDTTLVILDVRTPEELTGPLGKIDGVINIPVQELESRIGEVQKIKNKNIAVICRSGRRSAAAQEILLKHGIKSKNVIGGMQEFREE